MEGDPREVIRAALAAFERADAEGFAEAFDPEGELLLPRNLIEGGGYYGKAGIERAVRDAFTTWETIRFDIQGIDVEGDEATVRARVLNCPRGDGPDVEYQAEYHCRLRGGRVLRWEPRPA